MKELKDFLNESLVNEAYDKEIFQQIIDAINRKDEYWFYTVTFNDADGNTGYMILESQNNKVDKYLRQNKDFILNYKPIPYKEINQYLDFCKSQPSTFYCCGVTLNDENKTRGYLFTNIEEGSEKREFEKFLNNHLDNVDVI